MNVRNTALATAYLHAAGKLIDIGPVDENMGTLESWLDFGSDLGYGYYYDGVGNVGLENLSQVASISVNSATNKGTGDLILKGTEKWWVGEDLVSNDMNFDQSVTDFIFDVELTNTQFQYSDDFGLGPVNINQVNFAAAVNHAGDITLDSIHQTTSFAFNSIRSGGDIAGWTELDEGIYSEIFQFADTAVYTSGDVDYFSGKVDAVQQIWGSTNDGDILAQDLSQTLAMSSNTISANGSIRADIAQETDAVWALDEGNNLDLWGGDGDVVGGDLSQTMSLTINSIATRDILDAVGNVVTEGGDLSAAYVNQNAVNANLNNINYNKMRLETGGPYESNIDLGMLSQIAMLSLNSVDVAGDIYIGQAYDGNWGQLWQQGTAYDIGQQEYFGNQIKAVAADGLSLGVDTDSTSVQAAYLNLNSVSAGGTLSGGVDQDIKTDEYTTQNFVDAYSLHGLVSVANFAQVAQVNLNEVSAGVFNGAVIDQHIENGVEIYIDNTLSAVSDIGLVSVEGVVQQAIARVNSISGL